MARWDDKDGEVEDLEEEEEDGRGGGGVVEVEWLWLGGFVGFEVLGA